MIGGKQENKTWSSTLDLIQQFEEQLKLHESLLLILYERHQVLRKWQSFYNRNQMEIQWI